MHPQNSNKHIFGVKKGDVKRTLGLISCDNISFTRLLMKRAIGLLMSMINAKHRARRLRLRVKKYYRRIRANRKAV